MMWLRVLTLGTAQFFDFGTFVSMVDRHGIGAESNPLVADLFVGYGLPILAFAKLALVVLVASVAVVLGARSAGPGQGRIAGCILALGIAGGLVGGVANALAVI